MSEEDIKNNYTKLLEMFGTLPSHIHHPIQFARCVQLYKFYTDRDNKIDDINVAIITQEG
jgi:hypothetical protein